MIELGGNITLVGFKEQGYSELVVIKKIVGNYARKLSTDRVLNNLTITLKPIHHTDENSSKFEMKAKLDLDGKLLTSEVIEYNLFIGLDKILKKLEAQIN